MKRAITNEDILVAADRNTELIRVTMLTPYPSEGRRIVDAFITAYKAVEVSTSVEDEDRKLAILENGAKSWLKGWKVAVRRSIGWDKSTGLLLWVAGRI